MFLLNPSQVYIDPTVAEGSSCCAFSLLLSEFGNFGFPAVKKKFKLIIITNKNYAKIYYMTGKQTTLIYKLSYNKN